MRFLLTFLLMLAGFAPSARAASAPVNVVATFSILGDMIKQVGGGDVNVKVLVGPDADTHTYQPTPEDARALANADLVFVNGLGFEGWLNRLITASGYKGKIIIASQGVKARMMTEEGAAKEVEDPHAWQDLSNGRIYVRNIAAALEQAMPGEAAAISKRAIAYDFQLGQTDSYVRAQFVDIPVPLRKIITSHDAFGYFGDAYGVQFLAPAGLSTDAEPSAAGVAKLIEQIKAEGVHEVFIENMTNPRLVEQIAEDSGARMGGVLYSDALSQPGGPAPAYLDMFKNNVPKMKAAMMRGQI